MDCVVRILQKEAEKGLTGRARGTEDGVGGHDECLKVPEWSWGKQR